MTDRTYPKGCFSVGRRHCRSDSQAQAGFLGERPGTHQPGNALPYGPSRSSLPNTFLVLVISSRFSLALFFPTCHSLR
jgi:hypothetical protein